MKITGRHMDVTPALKKYIRNRFERLERYDATLDRLEIVLSVTKLQHTAEVVCSIKGKRFQAKTSTREMYATIDQLVDRLDRQIRKFKERRVEHKGRDKRTLPAPTGEGASDREDLRIVRPKIAVLSRNEARNRLEADPGAMVLFTCADSGKLQILRRSETGHVVLIDP
ncbi:MAG TPA: ribosome-associated translation inhibitor RaiA [Nitrospira sp.]|nr:ribosome-associated translation inhibitor RaiA [Nitrospira sp.]